MCTDWRTIFSSGINRLILESWLSKMIHNRCSPWAVWARGGCSCHSLINSDLQSISQWSESNGCKLDIGKCTAPREAPQDRTKAFSHLQQCCAWQRHHFLRPCHTHCTSEPLAVWEGCTGFKFFFQSPRSFTCLFSIPAHRNSISRGGKGRIQWLQNTVVHFAFNLRLFVLYCGAVEAWVGSSPQPYQDHIH